MRLPITHPIYGTLGDYEARTRPTIRFDDNPLRFNPTIIESGNGYLVAARSAWKHSELYTARLDQDFQPTGEWRKLNIPLSRSVWGIEDPRWFRLNGELFVNYVRFMGRSTHIAYAKINEETLEVERTFWPQLYGANRMEKNWAAFEHEGQLYFVYTISPHHIIKSPLVGEGEDPVATSEHTTPFTGQWRGGTMRGGATPVLHNGEFYHFFHGHTRQENNRRLYNCGLYTFSPKPQFQILRYMREPFDVADPATTPEEVPVDVIFPGSATLVDGMWAIAYGVHDLHCEVRFYDADVIEGMLVKHDA